MIPDCDGQTVGRSDRIYLVYSALHSKLCWRAVKSYKFVNVAYELVECPYPRTLYKLQRSSAAIAYRTTVNHLKLLSLNIDNVC